MTNRRSALLVLLAIGVVALALAAFLVWDARRPSIAAPAADNRVRVSISGHCNSLSGLPDPVCTPGASDPAVTQDNIQTTICVRGYTRSVRPAAAYTNSLKHQQIIEYGYSDTNPADYEEDHLIPLELGGHPTDPRNLWPQPRNGAFPAAAKDRVENSLHAKVCAGLVTLADAQITIARNWESTEAG